MRNLIRAEIGRLIKSKVFRIGLVVLCLLSILVIVDMIGQARSYDEVACAEETLFSVAAIVLFPLAGIASLFIGAHYSDGTMRNALLVGHRRGKVYLANTALSAFIGIALTLAWLVPYGIIGSFAMRVQLSPGALLLLGAVMLSEMLLFANIFALITMLNGSRAASAVICLIVVVVLLLIGLWTQSVLSAPEYYDDYVSITDGTVTYDDQVPNPNYLPAGSMKHNIFECINDINPGAQALQAASGQVSHPLCGMIFDAVAMAALCVIGCVRFRKKDIK